MNDRPLPLPTRRERMRPTATDRRQYREALRGCLVPLLCAVIVLAVVFLGWCIGGAR
jgi:hypothetical protein